jgi:hypothetical protein
MKGDFKGKTWGKCLIGEYHHVINFVVICCRSDAYYYKQCKWFTLICANKLPHAKMSTFHIILYIYYYSTKVCHESLYCGCYYIDKLIKL